jgi:membrane protease YdiL (CAAX protease family)
MPNHAPTRTHLVLLAVLFEGGLGALALLLGWWFEVPPLEHTKWDGAGVAWGLAGSIPLLLVFGLCLVWPVGPLASIKKFGEEFIRPMFRPCSILDLALISLLAGAGEEMLFRGVLQPLLTDSVGLWQGVLVTSVVFGLLHPLTPFYAVLATVVGVYLGWLFLATENLLVVIVAHGFYDFLALVYISRGGQVNAEQMSGEQASGEQASGEQASGEQASGEQASGEQASGEQASGEEASGEEASGE